MSLLDLVDVRKSFGPVEALRGVTFSVEAGEAVALLGDNGAGKSTLMKTITGIHRLTSGTIRLAGEDLSGKGPGEIRARGVEMIYQDLALARQQDVASNIFLGREPMRRFLGLPFIDKPRIEREAEAMIQRLGARVPSVRVSGRQPLGRAAAIGRHRPRADFLAQARHHGRADGGARGAGGGACA